MSAEVIDKIESPGNLKHQKRIKFLGISAIVLLLLRIYWGVPNRDYNTIDSISFWLCIVCLSGPIFIYLKLIILSERKTISPFIEWSNDKLSYKINSEKLIVTISNNEIKSIKVQLYDIIILTNNKTYNISLADFIEPADKVRIKSNFESLSKSVIKPLR